MPFVAVDVADSQRDRPELIHAFQPRVIVEVIDTVRRAVRNLAIAKLHPQGRSRSVPPKRRALNARENGAS